MDFEERLKMLLAEGDMSTHGDTFAERAEWYYQKRPQLLALLQDLYNGYTTLLDRSNRMEGKGSQRSHSSSMLATDLGTLFDQAAGEDSDAESSLSYQLSPTIHIKRKSAVFCNVDEMVADLVMKNVEKDILVDQVFDMEQRGQESWRKIDLLKKLLEVLESERLVLLNENATLGYKVQALMEENKGLSSEAMFMKRKAGELARCVLKVREDHRVYMLTRKIEDLQAQIYGLENRNQEYYQQLVMKKEQSEKEEKSSCRFGSMKEMKNRTVGGGGGSGYLQVALVGCFQVEKLKLKKKDEEGESYCDDDDMKSKGAKKLQKWWGKVKSMDLFMCGFHRST